jgi:type I restriction-modification system DNA methylase subunit
MAISKAQLDKIKSIIQNFINEEGMKQKEEHVQSSYTLEILKVLNWTSAFWKINTPQEVKTNKKPDLILRGNGGGSIFVVESKEPQKSLDDRYTSGTFVDQLCNYINAEGLYWGVLTNFVEWRVYNSYGKSLYFNKKYRLIIDEKNHPKVNPNDSELIEIFSLIERHALSSKKGKVDINPIYYKPEQEIKEEFFTNLKIWRKDLRNYIYQNYNKKYEANVIDAQVQKVLDRLIFIQVCFKKDIISQDYLGSILYSEKRKFYEELKLKFRSLDEKFNSELFAHDICDTFDIDNEISEDIIRGINGIDFSNLSVHIIGEVYENYLGELLKTTKKQIKSEESKEKIKRKSQGIFYTPEFIVNYIIEHTLNVKLKECKTEKEIEKIKVIDPACGSGSFLIKAYDCFYQAYKNARTIKKTGALFEEFEIRKKILLHNIYGVDLDERAVEIAKLNLFLKALEGLTESNVTGVKILPNLSLNIRCGNSLVSGTHSEKSEKEKQLSIFDKKSDYHDSLEELIQLKETFYDEQDNDSKEKLLGEIRAYEEQLNISYNEFLQMYFEAPEEYKPVNYDVLFCEIMQKKGFDCVIGNPPFVQLSMEKDFDSNYKKYLLETYGSAMGRFNTFGFFITKGIGLLKPNGLFGFIVPNTISTQEYYQELRKYILDNTSILNIVNYDKMPFKDAVVENITLIAKKEVDIKNSIELIDYTDEEHFKSAKVKQSFYNSTYKNQFIKLADKETIALKNKFFKNKHALLGNIVNLNQAIALKSDRSEHLFNSKKGNNYKPLLDGRNIDRYQIKWDNVYLKYDINTIHSCKRTDIFEGEKLFFRRVGSSLKATYDNDKFYALNTLVVITLKDNIEYSLKYILGVFNSKAVNFFYTKFLKSTKTVFSEIQARQIGQIPIPQIDMKDIKSKNSYNKIIKDVDVLLTLFKSPEKNAAKISGYEKDIDAEVCKLYGISLDEIE